MKSKIERLGMSVGLNWLVLPMGEGAIVFHGGGTRGFSSFLGFDLRREIGVVVLANSSHPVGDIGFHLLDPSFPLSKPATAWMKAWGRIALVASSAAAILILLFPLWLRSRDDAP